MVSRYNLLYDVPPEEFDLSERRFKHMPIVSILNTTNSICGNRHRVEDKVVQEILIRLDELSMRDFHSPVADFTNGTLQQDLNLEQVVDHLLRPRFAPQFQQHVLAHAPANLETTLYRQGAVRELIEKPEMAKCLEDGMELFAQLTCSILNRAYTFHQVQRMWGATRRHKLKILMPYNLDVLQRYTAMVNHFTKALEDAESKPMQRLGEYFADVRNSKFFKDIFPVFDISYFKDHRISLDVTIGRNGVLTASEYQSFDGASRIPAFRLISRTGPLGFISAFFKMLSLPSTFAMDATNTVVQKNIDELLKVVEIIAPLEFYTSGASFYRRMEEIGMPVQLPTILPKEERRMHLPNARNPLLLYQEGVDERNVSRVIPNDVEFDGDHNMFVITGSNNGGKTCYVKTGGLLQLLGQSGLPVTAEGDAYISAVDGMYTHFVSPDDIMAGEGRLLNELRRVEKIFRKATPHSYVILDEPCGGTEHSEGARQSAIILDGLHRLGSVVYFTTHLHEVADMVDNGKYPAGRNLQVEIIEDTESKRLIRTYRVLPGKATSSYGVEVARSIGLTSEGISGVIEERVQTGAFDRSLLRDK